MRYVDFDTLNHGKAIGPQQAEALARQDTGDIPLTAVAEARSIGERIKAFRERLAPDSPLQSAAFQTAAMCGQIEAAASAAIVEEHTSRQRDVVGEIYPTVPRELVAFCGPANFGLVVETAANLERNGMHVVAKWWRDSRGIIRGIAICEAEP